MLINIFFKTRSEDIPYLYNLVENYFQAINARVNNTNVKHQSSIVSRTDEITMVNEIAPKILKNKPFKKPLTSPIQVFTLQFQSLGL